MGTAHRSLLCSPRSAPSEQTGYCCPSIMPTPDLGFEGESFASLTCFGPKPGWG